jgi:hypothetical protein
MENATSVSVALQLVFISEKLTAVVKATGMRMG